MTEGHWDMHVNGRYLAVESAGAGPAVVFLHGIGGTSNVYQVQADALSSTYQVIRPDFAGRDDTLSSPSVSEQIARAHGSADLRVIDGIGHQIPLEDARQTTQILTTFIYALASRTGWPSQ
jgi:3-oxoadipate enol-lactonase